MSSGASSASYMMPRGYSDKSNTCPTCEGKGWLDFEKLAPDGLYKKDTLVWYAIECPLCKNGYDTRVEQKKRLLAFRYVSVISITTISGGIYTRIRTEGK